jgi:hypothetical protein
MLREIEGERLSSIEFVLQDYVQLRFDGSTLTVFNEPSIRTETSVVKWRDERFPNTLIGLTTHLVLSTEVREGDAVEIVFDNGAVFIVPLKEQDYTKGPEALTFDGMKFWVL